MNTSFHEFKLVFSGTDLYNEINIGNDIQTIRIGTRPGCTAKFNRDSFGLDFLILVTRTDIGWRIESKEGVYLQYAGKRSLNVDIPTDAFLSVYSSQTETKEKLFQIACLLNFENNQKAFDTRINLNQKAFVQGEEKRIRIGTSSNAHIQLMWLSDTDEPLKATINDNYSLNVASPSGTTHGIYVNGRRIFGSAIIRDKDFFSFGPFDFFLKIDNNDPWLYISNADKIRFNDISCEIIKDSMSSLDYPRFNRNTRVKCGIDSEPIVILDPPDAPKPPKQNLALSLLQPIIMLALIIVLRGFMSKNAGMYVIFSVSVISLGILMSIINHFRSKKEYKDKLKTRKQTYEKYLLTKESEIQEKQSDEVSNLKKMYPDSNEIFRRIESFSADLFDRTPLDDDFLHIRLGMGQRPTARKITYKPRETVLPMDDLQKKPASIAEQYTILPSAPIVVDLKTAGILGVVGSERESIAFSKVMISDICARQFYKDVSIFAVCDQNQIISSSWIRFLQYMPHFKKETGDGISYNIGCDANSCELQFEYLFKTLSQRENLTEKEATIPYIVVFVFNQMGLYSHPLSNYLNAARQYGVYFIFFARNPEDLPLYCGNIIQLYEKERGDLIYTSGDKKSCRFTRLTISDEIMLKISLKLAPVYCEEVTLAGNLPSSVSLFSLLKIRGTDDLNLEKNWCSARIERSMAAPIGLKSGNLDEPKTLDLHERADGPHGLLAGTTGSGKSEILQTYILSMAVSYSPHEVAFVIIDFKGGSTAKLFADLPHLLGSITDIDGKGINRSLLSIHAEVEKRKKCFDEADVNNITDYIRKHKINDPHATKPLPHLILVIDEFAELKGDQPEFMKEVDSLSRVGRSLGIHLILATQKLGGIITDQIWSNSNFKICLKVQSKSDSEEVLKSPLAAEIREPGRAYLKVGNHELELFQSAYSGAPAQSEQVDHVRPFRLFEVDICGRRRLIYERKKEISTTAFHEPETQLKAITAKIAQHCLEKGIHKLESICLPPLKNVIPYPESVDNVLNTHNAGFPVAVGVYDDPSTQSQNVFEFDMLSNNLLVIGAAQSGKSNLLLTIVRNLATRYTPKEVNIYIISFGPSMLGNYSALPHVGGVATESESEKVKNLFKLLNSEISLRKQKIMSSSSFEAYKDAHDDLPCIVLLIDNFTALKELYLSNDDVLLPVCRNGLSVGISVVIANQNTQGLGFRYLPLFSKRIALHCNDAIEYAAVFEHCRTYPDDIPGRGVIAIEKNIYELQVYCGFPGDSQKEQSEQQLVFVQKTKDTYGSLVAKQVPVIPDELTQSIMETDFMSNPKGSYEVTVGIDYEFVEPVLLNMVDVGAIGFVGKESPESRAVFENIFMQLASNSENAPVNFYFIDSPRRHFQRYASEQFKRIVSHYVFDSNGFPELIQQIHTELQERFSKYMEEGSEILSAFPTIIVVVDGNDPINELQLPQNKDALAKYKEIFDRYADMKICFFYMNMNNVLNTSQEVLRRLSESKQVFYFDDLKKMRLFPPSSRTGKHLSDDGYYFRDSARDNIPSRFKVAHYQTNTPPVVSE